MESTNLSNAGLVDAILSTDLRLVVGLNTANMGGATMERANMSGMQLAGARLVEADLISANLSQSNLAGADLAQADLSFADLHDANLLNANVSGANMKDADLSGTILARASDGQSLGTQPAAVRAAFRTALGNCADARWIVEHDAALARQVAAR
jgi:uncharacterized protein YjbI with pentapeptide repeats